MVKIKYILFPCKENDYRPLIISGSFFSYLLFFLVAINFIGVFLFMTAPKFSFFADVSRGVLVQLTNQERVDHGLPPLIESEKLNQVAYLKAQDMINNEYFSHWSPSGVSPWHWFRVSGYNYSCAGENLAAGFLDSSDVHRSWVLSPSHRENILSNNYTEIGIAVVSGNFYGAETYFAVQAFGAPASDPIVEVAEMQEVVLVEEPKTYPFVLGDYDNGVYISSEDLNIIEVEPTLAGALMTSYSEMAHQASLFSVLFVGFIITTNIFVRFDTQNKDLIFKGFKFFVLFTIIHYFNYSVILNNVIESPWIG
ncbi:MAG: CAP domain-containing protein [Candidatus Pacebacteria bacterium]|nr:CAP domain-containing protein [Candidatus Paceibacterota bacterium]